MILWKNSFKANFTVRLILGCVAQVHAENAELVKRNEKKLLNQGITGPEGKYMHST